jgi:hypothetical protein
MLSDFFQKGNGVFMVRLTQRGCGGLVVETGAFVLVVEADRGGQIADLTVKNDGGCRPLTPPADDPLADLILERNGERLRLSECHAEIATEQPAPDYLRLVATAQLKGFGEVRQEYEIHETGALFCLLSLNPAPAASPGLTGGRLEFHLALGAIRTAAYHLFSRRTVFKRDYATLHAWTAARMRIPLSEPADVPELAPLVGLDLGWSDTRFASNHLEFALEDALPLGDTDPAYGRTTIAGDGSRWKLVWHLLTPDHPLPAPIPLWRNRWAILVGRARTRRGPNADPAVRNNLLGCRVCHVKYPYARTGPDWPWVVMPIKQIPEQPPQLFQGNPPLERVEEAARTGADTVIVHQFWMRNPGANNEPPSDYVPFDPAWFSGFIERCHEQGLRVLPYIRGTEPWSLYEPFFESYCRKNWDGLYADWNSPFFMGHFKASPLHLSLYAYFHFTRALRQRVGPQGALIGHTNSVNMISVAAFDAALSGETSVRHDELLVEPGMTASYAGLAFIGGHLISGNLPDRKAFASRRAMAFCAALSMASQPAMEPGRPFAESAGYLAPLWTALRRLPGTITRLHNPAYAPTSAIHSNDPALFPSLWESDAPAALLLVTGLGQPAGPRATVVLEPSALEHAQAVAIEPLPLPGLYAGARVRGFEVALDGMPPDSLAAFRIRCRP